TAAMAALQSSFTAMNLSSSSFLGLRFSPSPCLPLVESSIEHPSTVVARIKRWERKECKPNSLPVLHKMHVKVGDAIKVISGKDKGRISEVSKVIRHNSTIVAKDINLKTKHVKSKEEGEPGQIIKIEAPIHSSNVMLYSKEKDVTSRVGHKTLESGKRVRYLIKTGEIIDDPDKWKRSVREEKKRTEVVAAASAS
ncbi:hypothetical protein M569_15402, partial [Genlisea aurea]